MLKYILLLSVIPLCLFAQQDIRQEVELRKEEALIKIEPYIFGYEVDQQCPEFYILMGKIQAYNEVLDILAD